MAKRTPKKNKISKPPAPRKAKVKGVPGAKTAKDSTVTAGPGPHPGHNPGRYGNGGSRR